MNVTIERIEIIAFGKLKNVSVTAQSGINILSAPNESGKSTLASFIKFVFYGYVGGRMQSLTDNEKRLYTPWDAEISEGSIYITADGEKYTVSRRCLASGKESVEVVKRNSGKAVFVGEIPGEVFFGVSEDVFARTLFFRQLTLPQTKDEILAERLRNIAISASEQVGTKKAVTELNKAKNEIKSRMGNGLMPKAESERDALEEAITASVDSGREMTRLNGEIKKRRALIDEAEKKLEALTVERKNIEKYEAEKKLAAIDKLALEERDAREYYNEAASQLKSRDENGEFRALYAKNTEYVAECRECETLSSALEEAEAERDALLESCPLDSATAKQARKLLASSKKTANILFIVAAVLAVVGIITALASKSTTGLGIVIAVLGVILCVAGAVVISKPSGLAKQQGMTVSELQKHSENQPVVAKQIHDVEIRIKSLTEDFEESRTHCSLLKRELDAGINKYIDVSGVDYADMLERILALSTESGERLAVWRTKKELLDTATEGVDVESLRAEAEGATKPERDRATVDRELSFYSKQSEQLSELNRRDELTVATLEAKFGDPATLIGKRDSLNEMISELAVKHKAYETAIAYIEESADYMKSMVAPRIAERADEYFTAATGGKYDSLDIDTKLSMSFGEDIKRSCEYLSAGTRDSAYLSLRLALADMLFGGCGVPMLLDDAFVRIDDNRLRMILGAIGTAAKKHQIFIFTHSTREADALGDVGIAYNEIAFSNEQR